VASSTGAPTDRLSRRLVAILAIATGLAVASNYYAQPLLPEISSSLHLSAAVAGLIVTAAQIGYALGLVFLLPLGDLLERRRLVVTLAVVSSLALVILGSAPVGAVLLPAAVLVGLFSVLAQILVPFAATLAHDHERGRVVGLVMSGLLLGILLARTVAGLLAAAGGWRLVYFVAAGAMAVQAVVLARSLPQWKSPTTIHYRGLLASVWALVRDEPVLRLRAVYGLLSFACFSVLWTSVAFLLARNYHYTVAVIGLFGLAGAGGAAAATVAGRLSDRGWTRRSTGLTTGILTVSWLALWLGTRSIAALVVGVVLLDVGAQGIHITNQGVIYALAPDARSRINSAYMTFYFTGGAAGSALSAAVYSVSGWSGVCVLGACFAGLSFMIWLVLDRSPAGLPDPVPATPEHGPAPAPDPPSVGMTVTDHVDPGTSDDAGRSFDTTLPLC
jgi:predicted MFS family arabinose efflux permease